MNQFHTHAFAQTAAPTIPEPGIVPQAPPGASGLAPGVVNGGVTLSMLFILLVLGWFTVKHAAGRFRDVLIGACIGVVGAAGIVGQLVWTVIGIGVRVVTAVGSGIAG